MRLASGSITRPAMPCMTPAGISSGIGGSLGAGSPPVSSPPVSLRNASTAACRTDASDAAFEAAAADALARHGERVHAYTHLSHLYAQGASVYTTFVYRLSGSYEGDLARWRALNK